MLAVLLCKMATTGCMHRSMLLKHAVKEAWQLTLAEHALSAVSVQDAKSFLHAPL